MRSARKLIFVKKEVEKEEKKIKDISIRGRLINLTFYAGHFHACQIIKI